MREVQTRLTPHLLLRGYALGVFPMADPRRNDEISWFAPDPRAILPLEDFHVPGNLGKLVDREPFEVVSDRAFTEVMRACADRESTWISSEIIKVYSQLHSMGHAHSVECYREDQLVGGLYGVALGSAFFGESMFYRVTDASKVALVHLVRQLRAGGFTLLDTQYSTPHLEQFGVVEVSRAEYERRLNAAVERDAAWWPDGRQPAGNPQT